jgi:hypothetical protein
MANAAQGMLTYFLRTVNAMRVDITPPLSPLPPPYLIRAQNWHKISGGSLGSGNITSTRQYISPPIQSSNPASGDTLTKSRDITLQYLN